MLNAGRLLTVLWLTVLLYPAVKYYHPVACTHCRRCRVLITKLDEGGAS